MKLILTTFIAASLMMLSYGGDSLTGELSESEKTNKGLEEALEFVMESKIYESEDGRFKINFLGRPLI
tara:strand:+ start:690 stop:893 length:204 start_codon:yes stop_codon:yes gene_type:complete